jgi:hypothetical protein
LCSEKSGEPIASVADENYPGLSRERRPLLFIAGDGAARDVNRRTAQRVGQLVADFIEDQLP